MSDDNREEPGPGRAARCPICGRPRVHAYRPFCSVRCRDVDLGRWFGEVYTVPAAEPGYEDGEDADGAPARKGPTPA